MCINSPRLYITHGKLEHEHLSVAENKMLIDGLERTMNECSQGIDDGLRVYIEKT